MRNKIVWCFLSCLLVAVLVLASCGKEPPQVTTPITTTTSTTTTLPTNPVKPTTPTAAGGNWWDVLGEPEYGGTLIHRTADISTIQLDPAFPGMQHKWVFWLEQLFMPNWTLDRNVWGFDVMWTPMEYAGGCLAESWEQPDPLTVILHLRKGVHWQNKKPVNGREFVADDVVYNFDRIMGTGSGYTALNSKIGVAFAIFNRPVATDKYTVTITLKSPSAFALDPLLNNLYFMIGAREWFELEGYPPAPNPKAGGPLTDWTTVVGTGPWILKDYIPSVSITYVRNPDYWGYDERHPENQLPYLDSWRDIAIIDSSTYLAALRTRKIDLVADISGPNWQEASSLAKTNPEIIQKYGPGGGRGIDFNLQRAPFKDIKVRIALQKAVDVGAIAKVLFGDIVSPNPAGYQTPAYGDYVVPFEEWSAKLKEEYTYDPVAAKKLLAEAGYPNGFTTMVWTGTTYVEFLEAIKSYLAEIGVELKIEVGADSATYNARACTGNYDMVASSHFQSIQPLSNSFQYGLTGQQNNYGQNTDQEYVKWYNQFLGASTFDEAKTIAKKLYMRPIEEHWAIFCGSGFNDTVWQPYIKGYIGELIPGYSPYYARIWLDVKMKKAMTQ